MTGVLDTFRRLDRTGWKDAWIGIEPTFQSKKTVRLWKKMSVMKQARTSISRATSC